MNFTPLSRRYFKRIDQAAMQAAEDIESSQRALLSQLLSEAAYTRYGAQYRFRLLRSHSEYVAATPIVQYEDIRPWVMRMVNGENNLLWPGRCTRYAQSSGTSGGVSKYIPLTDRSLSQCHFKGGSEVVARYLALYPDSRLFAGKSFVLGGSYSSTTLHPEGVKVGDLSASLIDCINPVANLFRVPSKKIALMEDWRKKLPALVKATARRNITSLSGVPSWFLTVIKEVMKERGATEIHQVWPNLEVFFHGGIAFGPYREQYNALIDPARMRYLETYNASEGFFAVQSDPADSSMMLLMNNDIFYEFLPLDQLEAEHPQAIPAWEVEAGRTYALIITSSNGLWRYMIGDTVTVTSVNPLKIKIAGRTRSFINAFGEELMVHNADAAIADACRITGALVSDYTAAPVFATDGAKAHHQWFVEFEKAPESISNFASELDAALRRVNSDYDAKRSGDIFLAAPEIVVLPPSTFNRYLASTGKLGGQRKVPRLKNDRSVADAIIRLIND